MNEKKWLLSMKLNEAPRWWMAMNLYPMLSWILIWPAKAYLGYWFGIFFFGNWALGTSIYIYILMFHSYQYPCKRSK